MSNIVVVFSRSFKLSDRILWVKILELFFAQQMIYQVLFWLNQDPAEPHLTDWTPRPERRRDCPTTGLVQEDLRKAAARFAAEISYVLAAWLVAADMDLCGVSMMG